MLHFYDNSDFEIYNLSEGNDTVTIVPSLNLLSIFKCPLCLVTICLTIAKPRPVPPKLLDRPLSTL